MALGWWLLWFWLLLGLGCRQFHDFGSDVLELLCGIEAADEVFAKLFGHVKLVLGADLKPLLDGGGGSSGGNSGAGAA